MDGYNFRTKRCCFRKQLKLKALGLQGDDDMKNIFDYILLRSVIIILSMAPAFSQESQTLTWLPTTGSTTDAPIFPYDYYLQYYTMPFDGVIESISFNLSDIVITDFGIETGLSVRLFLTSYPDWQNFPSSELADSCAAGHLGYYSEVTGHEVTGENWIHGGINSVAGIDPLFIYDPLAEQLWPAMGFDSLELPAGEQDSGLVMVDLSDNTVSLETGEHFAVVVGTYGLEGTELSASEIRTAFVSDTLLHEAQPSLRFCGTWMYVPGYCGHSDWGWYITDQALDWTVNVLNTTAIDHWVHSEPLNVSAYPNPFNSSIQIEYDVAESSHQALVQIFNLNGRLVWTHTLEVNIGGPNSLYWHGLDNSNQALDSGVYIIKISSGNMVKTSKIALIR